MAVGGHADNTVDLCGEDSACFSHHYHLTLVDYIKPQNTQSVCTTRGKETDGDTFSFKKMIFPPKKKYPVSRAQDWGVLFAKRIYIIYSLHPFKGHTHTYLELESKIRTRI